MVLNKVSVFDLDGTVIKGFTEYYFYLYLYKNKVIGLTALLNGIFCFLLFKLKLLGITPLRNKFASILAGLKVDSLEQLVDKFFNEEIKPKIFSEVPKIIERDKKRGLQIVLSTAAFDRIAKGYIGLLKADYLISTKLGMAEEEISGQIDGIINYGKNKKILMDEFIKCNNVDVKNSRAYANDISDLNLLKMFGHPKACNPDTKLLRKAKEKGWEVLIFN